MGGHEKRPHLGLIRKGLLARQLKCEYVSTSNGILVSKEFTTARDH